jgi:hypothetical protein
VCLISCFARLASPFASPYKKLGKLRILSCLSYLPCTVTWSKVNSKSPHLYSTHPSDLDLVGSELDSVAVKIDSMMLMVNLAATEVNLVAKSWFGSVGAWFWCHANTIGELVVGHGAQVLLQLDSPWSTPLSSIQFLRRKKNPLGVGAGSTAIYYFDVDSMAAWGAHVLPSQVSLLGKETNQVATKQLALPVEARQ